MIRRPLPIVVAFALLALGAGPTYAQWSPAWLAYVNRHRATAGLPFLTEEASWSDGDVKHARYTVRTDILAHSEDPSKPDYTPEGDLAARNSNVMASSGLSTTDDAAIAMWMRGPFHAVGILDPRLARTGFGSFRESGPSYQMAAALDVLRGRGAVPAGLRFPVMWPAPGRRTPLTSYTGGEYPNPLSSCAGYAVPTGLPIVLQLGSGSVTPQVTATSLLENGVAVPHCVFDETSYVNSDASAQSLGRSVLGSRDAVVMIPRSPLVQGRRYTVSITTGGVAHTWTFRVGPFAHGGTAGDRDADAVADVAVYRPSTGTWFSLDSGSGRSTYRAFGWGVNALGDVPVAGDFDGDGTMDPAVYRPATGTWFVLKSSSAHTEWTWFGWGEAADTVTAGDYDGDGVADAAVYRPSSGTWFVRPSSGAGPWSVAFGEAGDVPVAGDFDGDGRRDPAVYRAATGTWFWLKSSTGLTEYESRGWGVEAMGDTPAPDDFDGDGKTDPCVFRPGTGTWFVLESSGGYATWNWFGWGTVGDEPRAGDYDGDGKADGAVFRPSTGTWYVRPSSGAAPWNVVFGAAGDVAIGTIR